MVSVSSMDHKCQHGLWGQHRPWRSFEEAQSRKTNHLGRFVIAQSQGDCAAGQHARSQSLLKLQVARHHQLALLCNYVFPGPQQPSAIPVIAEASLVLSLSTTQAQLWPSIFLTSPLYICLPKWHCTLQCVTQNILLPKTGLHASTHCDEPLACFKAFGF